MGIFSNKDQKLKINVGSEILNLPFKCGIVFSILVRNSVTSYSPQVSILSLNDESAIFTNNGKNLFVFDGSTISNTSISDRFIQGGTVSLNFFNFVMIKLFDTKIVNKKNRVK